MKLERTLLAVLASLALAVGCDSGEPGGGGDKTGGQPGSGGRASGGSGGRATGGGSGGGAGASTGGATGSGGRTASGGTSTTGGATTGGTGGATTGGTGGTGSGGVTSLGGAGGVGGAGGSDGGVRPDARDALGPGGDGGSRRDGGTGGAAGAGGTTASGGAGTGGAGTGGAGTGGATATGGTTSTGGATGGGGGTSHDLCTFASGLNVAWVSFAGDVPNPQTATFSKIFKDTYDNGGRIVRWWFHTNGTVTPGYNADGTVKKIQQSHIDGVKAILETANANKVALVISLWSFDMAQNNASTAAANNKRLMTEDAIRQSYIDNYLTDLVKGLKGTPGLYAYENFNEPEGMSTTGWAEQWKIDISYIQKAVNQWTAAIKAADPTVPVTNGSQTMDYRERYKDAALVAVGGQPTGTLDFYQVHYYQVNGAGNNVFANPRSFWGLGDKKLVIGEFAAYSTDTAPVAVNDSYTYLFDKGYDGAWGWSYTEGRPDYAWPSMKTPMANLYSAQKATVDACP